MSARSLIYVPNIFHILEIIMQNTSSSFLSFTESVLYVKNLNIVDLNEADIVYSCK